MRVNESDYHVFWAVGQTGSFTRAAALVRSNQPNVTRCIRNLEHDLGCRLFTRGVRGATLTPEGRRLYDHVCEAQAQLREGESELAGRLALSSGTVRVGASETAINLFLLERLARFRAAHPGIRLRLANQSTPQAVKALASGAADCAVVTTPVEAPPPLAVRTLLRFQEIAVAGSAFKRLAGRRLHLKDLLKEPFICLEAGTMSHVFHVGFFARHGLALRPDTEVATADQLLPLVRHGLGVAFVPEALAKPDLDSGAILRLDLAETVPARAVCLVTDSRAPRSVAADAFCRGLEK